MKVLWRLSLHIMPTTRPGMRMLLGLRSPDVIGPKKKHSTLTGNFFFGRNQAIQRGGGSPGDNFDGENFVTPPILVQGHQTQERNFSCGENFATTPTLGSLWTISCVQSTCCP